MDEPTYGYADSDGIEIVYAVFGDGPIDVVVVTSLMGNVGTVAEVPWYREVVERVPKFARLILFDKRGEGLSGGPTMASYEEAIDDIGAVMDAVGSERAVLLVNTDASPLGLMFAASRPDRVLGLGCRDGWARLMPDDDYPHHPEAWTTSLALDGWGSGVSSVLIDGGPDDDALRRAAGHWERARATPKQIRKRFDLFLATDVRFALPLVACPTLMVSNAGDPLYTAAMGRYVSEQVPSARYVELPFDNMYSWSGEAEHAALDEFERFVREDLGVADPEPSRQLMTVLFTDLVDSTRRALEHGDESWRRLLDRMESDARRVVEAEGGRVEQFTGDGLLARFDGPGRAVKAALRLRDAAEAGGLSIRAGIHAGEVELRGEGIGGLAVHLASRIEGAAQPGEVLVSGTVVDLTIGSSIRYVPREPQTFKGFDRPITLFAVED